MGLFGKTESVELAVAGMTCGNCVRHVTDALARVPGVKKVSVDLDGAAATVVVEQGTGRSLLVDAVREAGYAAE